MKNALRNRARAARELARRFRRRPGPDPGRAALLLVDLQRLFADPAAPAPVRGWARALRGARRLLAAFRAARRPVVHAVFARAENRRARSRGDPAAPRGTARAENGRAPRDARNPMLRWWRRPPCAAGSLWARPARGLEPAPGELLLAKQRYSAFRGTGLAAWLRARGVAELVVAGVRTNLCVEASVRDAFEEGFRVFVALDACAAPERALHAASLRTLAQGFAGVAPSSALSRAVRAAAVLPIRAVTAVNRRPDHCQCLILERPPAEETWRRSGGCSRPGRRRACAAKAARSGSAGFSAASMRRS